MKFMTALAILFIALKLCGVIGWAWWLVLLPLYGGAVVFLTIFGVMILAGAAGIAVKELLRKRRK